MPSSMKKCRTIAVFSVFLSLAWNVSAQADGGVNGGGGGTLPADPVSVADILKIVQQAKPTLRVYILGRLREEKFGHVHFDFEHRLYDRNPNIFDILESTDIDLKMSEPCYDADKREVDGSIYASKPNAICISAFRIAPKLSVENARTETLALILHELSHLLGTNEGEAVDYQKAAVKTLRDASRREILDWTNQLSLAASQLSYAFSDLLAHFYSLTPDALSNQLERLSEDVEHFENFATRYLDHGGLLSLFGGRHVDFFEVQRANLFLATQYAISRSSLSPQNSDAQKTLDTLFGNAAQVPCSTVRPYINHNYYYPTPPANLFDAQAMRRIQSSAELKMQLGELDRYFSEVYSWARAVFMDWQLPVMHDPWNIESPNPWIPWIGHYQVTAFQCSPGTTQPTAITELVVEQDATDPNSLLLIRHWDPGQKSSEPLKKDGYFRKGYLQLSGDTQSASVAGESGHSWSYSWFRASAKIEARGRLLEYVESQFTQEWNIHGVKVENQECRYQIVRK